MNAVYETQRNDLENCALITQETNSEKLLMQLQPRLKSLHLQLCVASQEEVNILYENTLFLKDIASLFTRPICHTLGGEGCTGTQA